MKSKIFTIGGFSLILVVYALLYTATTKRLPCEDTCEKIGQVSASLQNNRPFVNYAYQCGDSGLCVVVRDTIPYSWNLLADTACIYLKTQSLFNYNVTVLKISIVDTIGQQKCP